MVNKQLSVVHLGEYVDIRVGIHLLQMPCLRFGGKGFQCAIPIVYIGPVNEFQLIGIYRLVAIQYRSPAAERIHLFAFVQQYIEIMGVEHPTPESCPMITSPYIGALVVAKRPNQPLGQRQKRCCIQNGVVDDNFVTFQHAG